MRGSEVRRTYTKHGPGPGSPHGPGPWTSPNFQRENAHFNMKIYWRSGYEKHRLIFFHPYTLIANLCLYGKLRL